MVAHWLGDENPRWNVIITAIDFRVAMLPVTSASVRGRSGVVHFDITLQEDFPFRGVGAMLFIKQVHTLSCARNNTQTTQTRRNERSGLSLLASHAMTGDWRSALIPHIITVYTGCMHHSRRCRFLRSCMVELPLSATANDFTSYQLTHALQFAYSIPQQHYSNSRDFPKL